MSIDFSQMSKEELDALADEARKAATGKAYSAARELPEPAVISNRIIGTQTPPPSPSQDDKYVATAAAWLSNEFDFVVPSGLTCRLKKVQVEDLVAAGIIDKITRLPGLAQQQIDKAEGKPPAPDRMPTTQEMEQLTTVLNTMIPLVVARPVITPLPESGEEKVVGFIYPDSIDLADRVAIMERVLTGVRNLDKFRNGSGELVQRLVHESGNAVPPL
jgi:hypothetical protein